MREPSRSRPRDTIYAPATGSGISAIAIVRISGGRANDLLGTLTDKPLPPPRVLERRWILDRDGGRLDDVMIVRFAAGASYTGEAMAEIQCHGSRAVVAAISERLSEEPDCRLARPGEFSRRALENGKLDLAEVEGLADLIAAETDLQRRQAVRIMSGELSRKVTDWRAAILRACALIELSIDWVEEEIPEDVLPEVRGILGSMIGELDRELDRARSSQRLREGFEVAILGAPNVGKSTLLNFLAGREAAIVSEIPGTTRDVIEVRYDLEGLPVTFLDTAGIREGENEVESIGISRAIERARNADLRIVLQTPDRPVDDVIDSVIEDGDVLVWSKSDIHRYDGGRHLSVRTGAGIDGLLAAVHSKLKERVAEKGLLAHLRHEEATRNCYRVLAEAREGIGNDELEITAERLRLAAYHLEAIVGRIDVEQVLDTVFGSFCLGK